MEPDRLSKLAIERQEFSGPRRRRWVRRVILVGLLVGAMVVLGHLYRQGVLTPATEVKLTSLSLVYPSQVITDLNSSGYCGTAEQGRGGFQGDRPPDCPGSARGEPGEKRGISWPGWNPTTSRLTSIRPGRSWVPVERR